MAERKQAREHPAPGQYTTRSRKKALARKEARLALRAASVFGTAFHANAMCAPRKARRLRALVCGRTVAHAVAQLKVGRRSGSCQTAKLLEAALVQLPELDRAQALVAEFEVNEGISYRRFMPRAQGRASPYWKRTSHLRVVVRPRAGGSE